MVISKFKVGLLGRQGVVGQMYEKLLENHPNFELVFAPLRDNLADVNQSLDFVFSALPSEAAIMYESLYTKIGIPVFSSASIHRLKDNIPLIIPEVNGRILKNYHGKYIAKPNCSVQSIILSLYPLHKKFMLKKIHVTSLQSISGAGRGFDLKNNIIPYIEGEEEKIKNETRKILNIFDLKVAARCIRIPVDYGHQAFISASFYQKPSLEQVLLCWNNFKGLGLHSSPEKLLEYFEEEDRPQPALDANKEKGMSISLGRLRKGNVFDIEYTALSHNLIRGAAGGGVLCAELFFKEKYK